MSDTSTQSSSSGSHHSQSGGNFLSHRLGPLPMWGWFAVVLGGIILYKYLHNRSAAASANGTGTVTGQNNANSLFGTEGFSVNGQGQIVDNATGAIVGTSGSGTSGSAGSTGTNADWFSSMQQALFRLGYDNASVDQALQDYSAGLSLPQNEYNIIESGIRLVGNPPSGIALPLLSSPPPPAPPPAPAPAPAAAPTPPPVPTTAPGLPSALINAMTANGEYIVNSAYDAATGQWLYLTQKGGVYGGAYGSIFSLSPGTFAGRTASQITPLANGGYTITDTAGEKYTFSPTPGSNYANSGPGNNYQPT